MPRIKNIQGAKVTFTLIAPEAKKVTITGDFNKWEHKSISMRKNKDHLWKKSLILKPGRYEYKFVVDGNWISDPNNSNRVLNSFGTENSVIEVGISKYNQ